MNEFRLLMISAMYENGGNTTHRILDGHPQCFVYPFESQLGTRYVNDLLASMFPLKYRWPEFLLGASPEQDYRAIIDEEAKVRARTPQVSKFRHKPFDLSDDDRCDRFVRIVREQPRSRGGNVAAFFRATFDTWNNCNRSGHENLYVGYSPIIVIDAEKILADLPDAQVLHVVRNPWSAYADTKKRPVPMRLADYMTAWTLVQRMARVQAKLHPGRVHILRYEDLIADPGTALAPVLHALRLDPGALDPRPTWNGAPLDEVYPWGTIRTATPEANRATAHELSPQEIEEIEMRADLALDAFAYRGFLREQD